MAEICFVGEEKPGSRAVQRLRAMREMGHDVRFFRSHPPGETYESRPSLARRIRYRLHRPADAAGLNRALAAAAETLPPPTAVWVDYTLTIHPRTLRKIRRRWPRTSLIWYAEDDMMQPHNGSVWLSRSIPMFDLWVTTKSFNARPEEIPARGARRVLFVDNSYDPEIHRPVALTADERERYGAEVSFVGTYEATRARSIARLAEAGLSVRIWGNGWSGGAPAGVKIERRPVYGRELAAVYAASAVNLAFLRRLNRDLQTCRTVEIPACGGFMLHERNDEVRTLLAENREAAFFDGDDELVASCRHWLDNPEARERVARAGWERIAGGRFTHAERIEEILDAAGCR